MLTNIELSDAKMLAKIEKPTIYQKKRLVKLFLQLIEIIINFDSIDETHERFNELYDIALNYFRYGSDISNQTKKVLQNLGS